MKSPGHPPAGQPFGAAGQLFAYATPPYTSRGGRMTLQDAKVVQRFFRPLRDLGRAGFGVPICELLATEGEEDVPVPGLLRLALMFVRPGPIMSASGSW